MSAVYACTFPNWFERLRDLPSMPLKVAFWLPTPRRPKEIGPGEPWFLKARRKPYLIGFGRYEDYEITTPEKLWNRFGVASGAAALSELIQDIEAAHRKKIGEDTKIGNVILTGFTAFPLGGLPIEDFGLGRLVGPFQYVPDSCKTLTLAAP